MGMQSMWVSAGQLVTGAGVSLWLDLVQAESENDCPAGAAQGDGYAQQLSPTLTYVSTAAHGSVVSLGGGQAGAVEGVLMGEATSRAADGGVASQARKRRPHTDRGTMSIRFMVVASSYGRPGQWI